jgi:hypothetical protein
VIHLLRDVRQKDLKTVSERGMVVLVFLRRLARGFDDLLRTASSPGLGWRRAVIFMCGPISMWPSIECMTCALASLSSLSLDIGVSFMFDIS